MSDANQPAVSTKMVVLLLALNVLHDDPWITGLSTSAQMARGATKAVRTRGTKRIIISDNSHIFLPIVFVGLIVGMDVYTLVMLPIVAGAILTRRVHR